MMFDVQFEEQEQRLHCDFGEVHEIADAESFGKGYNEGKKDGYAEGYGDGETTGRAEGFEDGKQAGYDEGYQAGGAALDGLLDGDITDIKSNAKNVRKDACRELSNLTNVNLPLATSLGSSAFAYCSNLTSVNLPLATSLGNYVFYDCSNLSTLILRASEVCTIASYNALSGTAIASGDGHIYVPSALVDSYKVNANWAKYAAQFRAIEDYPEICEEVI